MICISEVKISPHKIDLVSISIQVYKNNQALGTCPQFLFMLRHSASGILIQIWWPDWPTMKVISGTQSWVSIKALKIWHVFPACWKFLSNLYKYRCCSSQSAFLKDITKVILYLTQSLKHSDLHYSFQYDRNYLSISEHS